MSVAVIKPQHELSLVDGVSPEIARARLARVVWAAPRDQNGNPIGPPGLHDLRGTQRTALVNDLSRHNIDVQVRLRDLDALRAVLHDPEATELRIVGPARGAIVAGNYPEVEYVLTTAWQDVPVVFANWLDYARGTERRLGAGFTKQVREKVLGDGGEVVYGWRFVKQRPVDLFEFRMPGEANAAETPRGVAVPAAAQDPQVADLLVQLRRLQQQVNDLSAVAQPLTEAGPDMPQASLGDPFDRPPVALPDDDDDDDHEPPAREVEAALAAVAAKGGGATRPIKGRR